MRRLFVGCSLSLLYLLLALPAWAVHSKEKQSRLVIDQEAGEVKTKSPAGNLIDTKKLAEKMPYEVDPNEILAVIVDDPNPLLFTYTWKLVEATPTANFTVLSEFVTSFKTLAGLLKGLDSSSQPSPEAAITEFKALSHRSMILPRAASPIQASTAESVILKVDEKKALADYGDAINDLADYMVLIPQLISTSAESYAAAEQVKLDAATAKPGLLQKLEAGLKAVDDIETRLVKEKAENVPSSVFLAKDQESHVRDSMAKLKSFLDAAKAIHVVIVLDPPIQFDATKDGGGTLEIGIVKGSEQAATKASAKGKPGKYTFSVAPYSPVDFSVGPAAIYSFIETQEFGTKTENGKITIVRKDSGNQVNGLTVGAMLSITPRAWSNPTFRGSIQMGASPVKDKIGLFLGGGIQFFTQLSIGGGIAYQQAQRLAPGLALNQEIASEDKLKTNVVFKSGFYLTITLDFGGKK